MNYGDISAVAVTSTTQGSKGYSFAYGTSTHPQYTYYASTATTVNGGNISATAIAYVGAATSVGAQTTAYYAGMYNYAGGTISAISAVEHSGRADATGVSTSSLYYSHDVNFGTISAYASTHALNDPGQYFDYGGSNATGLSEFSVFGSVLENYGDISATAITRDAPCACANGASAVGVDQYSIIYFAGTFNYGDISATASTNYGIAAATGVNQTTAVYDAYLGNMEGASIIASASSGSTDDDQFGGRAIAQGVRMRAGGYAIEYNFGQIIATAVVDPNDRNYVFGDDPYGSPALALAYGSIIMGEELSMLRNYGDIQAYARADYAYATAYGTVVTHSFYNSYEAITYNAGEISAFARADHGNAFSVGADTYSPGQRTYHQGACNYYGPGGYCYGFDPGYYTYAGGDALLSNQGDITAVAHADDGVAYAYGAVVRGRLVASTSNGGAIVAYAAAEGGAAEATGSLTNSFYGYASLDNSGSISAWAYADYATAIGATAIGSFGDEGSGYSAALVTNSGSITAVSGGVETSTAIAVSAIDRYDSGVTVVNEAGGEMIAAAYGPELYSAAIAVSMYSDGSNLLTNSGDIIALGDGLRVAVASSAFSVAAIYNHGTMTGSIQTGDYDDYLYNDGTWNAIQASYFGAGDDYIYNVRHDQHVGRRDLHGHLQRVRQQLLQRRHHHGLGRQPDRHGWGPGLCGSS